MTPQEAAVLGQLRAELETRLRRIAGELEKGLQSPRLEHFLDDCAEAMHLEPTAVHSYSDRPNFIQSEAAERNYFKLRGLVRRARDEVREEGLPAAIRCLGGLGSATYANFLKRFVPFS